MATALKHKLSYHRRLFLLLLVFSWTLVGCFILFQYGREKHFKAERLDAQLQLFNLRMLDAVNAGAPPDAFIARSGAPCEGVRVTLIDPAGHVVFDNSLDTLPGANHLDRPEVAEALARGTGYTIRRHSESTDRNYFYSAMRGDRYIVRSAVPYSVPLGEILAADREFLWFMLGVTLLSSRGCMFYLVGLPDSAVKESHQRIISALQVNGYRMPTSNIVINMAPADIRKEGAAYDLPLAIGILAASEVIQSDKLERYLLMGELSLDGSLQPIKGALPIAIKARELGFEGMIVPQQNAHEAAVVNNLKVYGVGNIKEVIEFFNGTQELTPTLVNTREEFYSQQSNFDFDFAEVKGQENVKRALEVAASGSHNILLIGSPGSGKSMLAKRLPSILPPLSLGESLETTKIHSVAGKLGKDGGLISKRPFRDPHHTISTVAMTGGGSFPQPGEISLAHNGILYLDELPEYSRNVLEVLRQPLEDRKITVSRIRCNVEYPASFMLVASMNPCPCGYYTHPTKACVCSPGQVQKYLNRISGPLLDRIDLQIEVTPLPFEEMADSRPGESSATIRERVIRARQIQEARYADIPGIYCNAQMNSKLLARHARPDDKGLAMLKTAMNRLNLSARAYDRILKVSRTIADLEGCELIQPAHLAEAIGYRNLDKEGWAG